MSSNAPGHLIELYQSENSVMADAIDRIIIKLYAYKEQFQKRTILLTGCGSATGTTTCAINLATALAGAGWNTLFVDADLRKRAAYKRLNGFTYGLSDYLEDHSDLDGITYATNAAKLSFVPSGWVRTGAVRLLCSEKMQTFVSSVRDAFDFVVFDCPSLTIVPDATVLFPAVDCIALVLALDITTKKQLARAKREIETYADKYAGLIVNRVDQRQYDRAFPQHDYFEEENMRKTHKRFLKKSSKKGA